MASYAVAFALLLPSWVRGHLPRVADEVEAAWTEGWKTILRSGVLRNLLVLDTLLCLIGMAAFSITIAFLEQDLHLAPQANGWLLATTGLFGAVGTQLGGRLVNRQRVYIVGTFMIAVSYLLVPHATTLPLLLAMWSLRGVAIGVLGVLINQRLAEEVSGAVMGRVNAAWSLAACLAAFVGGASTPWLIRTIGPAQAYTLFGVLLVLVAALFGAVELGRLVRPKVRVDLAA